MKIKEYQGYLVNNRGNTEFHIVLDIRHNNECTNLVFDRQIFIQIVPLKSPINILDTVSVASHFVYEEWKRLEKCLIAEDVRYFQTQRLGNINTFFGMQGASALAFNTTPEKHLQNLIRFNKLTSEGGRWLPVDENSGWANSLPISHPQRRRKAYFEPLEAALISPEESDNLNTVIYSTNIGLILSTSNTPGYFKVAISDVHISKPIINIEKLLNDRDFACMEPGPPIAGLKRQFEHINAKVGTFIPDLIPIKVEASERHLLPIWHPQYQNRYMQLSEIEVGKCYIGDDKVKKLVSIREGPISTSNPAFKGTIIVELETMIDRERRLDFMELHYFRLLYRPVVRNDPPQVIAEPTPVLPVDKKLKDKTYSKNKYIPEKPKTIIEWHML